MRSQFCPVKTRFKEGLVEVKVWKQNEYDDDGGLVRIDYFFDVSTTEGVSHVMFVIEELSDLVTALTKAMEYVKEHTDITIRERMGQLFQALQEPSVSR